MTAGPVAVLAATGRVGSLVVRALRAARVDVRALGRTASGAGAVHVDLADPSTLRPALAGCGALLLCTPDAPDQAEREGLVIAAASDAGVGHCVKISAQSAGLDPPVSFGVAHARSEQVLRRRPMTWTVVRPTVFQQTLLLFARDVAGGRPLIAPAGRGAVAFVDTADVADVAVAALTRPDLHGRTLTVTGPRAVTFAEVADLLSARLGRRVRHLSPPLPLARRVLPRATGMPRWQSDLVVDLFAVLQRGAQADPTRAVPDVLGRPAADVALFLDRHTAAFSPTARRTR